MRLVSGAIIEVALNGGIPKPSNPHVPRTPDEIVADALACIAAGAAIVHNHNDEPTIGGPPSHDPAPYEQVWRAVLAEEPDAMLYPTMRGWGPDTTIEQRYSHVVALAEAGVLGTTIVDLGPINVAPVDALGPARGHRRRCTSAPSATSTTSSGPPGTSACPSAWPCSNRATSGPAWPTSRTASPRRVR